MAEAEQLGQSGVFVGVVFSGKLRIRGSQILRVDIVQESDHAAVSTLGCKAVSLHF
jgi:hypothetical protein